MEICRTCRHVQALHAGHTEHCRLNGCPCTAFATPANELDDSPETPREIASREVDVVQRVLVGALAFVAGVIVGCQL